MPCFVVLIGIWPILRSQLRRGCSRSKGPFQNEFGLKTYVYGSFQNVPATLGHTIAWIGAIVWPLLHSNFGWPYLSHPNSDSCVLRLYENIFESRI